jgi:hypothetical protein
VESILLTFHKSKYQYLADKYAPSDSEISSTLAKLQLPPELKLPPSDRTTFVPLPSRRPAGSKQQTAEAIRDGRRASQNIASLLGWRTTSETGQRSTTDTSDSITRTSVLGTSATTVFEQDFTVPGKKSQLLCPFAAMSGKPESSILNEKTPPTFGTGHDFNCPVAAADSSGPIHPPSADPICAALHSEAHPSPPPSGTGSAAKCPIRFLDQHSPEDVAKYFETHKHEIPRSHEICVKRYQRNEEDIRKLDAKYGNLVAMISGLGQKHQPILQLKDEEQGEPEEGESHERVQNWAKAVSADAGEGGDVTLPVVDDDEDRQGHFDRPMKEIRVGESPSRPWGISVPFVDPPYGQEERPERRETAAEGAKAVNNAQPPNRTAGKCPFDHNQELNEMPKPGMMTQGLQAEVKPSQGTPPQPTFIYPPELQNVAGNVGRQMIFTGPVFIGYPVEQAMTLMQHWQAGTAANGRS